jgi:ABC-type bacteriocin/lantibiotic exporter with double-glycine peptidase domain
MKHPIVLQHSEEDCGAACLATVAKHYGRIFTISRVREAVGTGARGTTLLGLNRGAEFFGFNVRQVKATAETIEHLKEIPLPAIIHWKGYHWIVLYGKKGKKFIVADPSVGIRYITREELTDGWGNGVMLLLIPDDSRFYEQDEDDKGSFGGFGRYLKRVFPYRWILFQAIAINFAVGLLSLASPIMMQLLTDDVLVRGDTQLLATVAIARSIVTDPPILILDESTGALDPVSEARVLKRLFAHRQGKTTILISHRPRVIVRADWIMMLEKGELKIQGTPEKLRSMDGDHLDFLDDFIPTDKPLVELFSNSYLSGHH